METIDISQQLLHGEIKSIQKSTDNRKQEVVDRQQQGSQQTVTNNRQTRAIRQEIADSSKEVACRRQTAVSGQPSVQQTEVKRQQTEPCRQSVYGRQKRQRADSKMQTAEGRHQSVPSRQHTVDCSQQSVRGQEWSLVKRSTVSMYLQVGTVYICTAVSGQTILDSKEQSVLQFGKFRTVSEQQSMPAEHQRAKNSR